MKIGPGVLGIAENESGSIKHENWTRHPWFRWKRVWERKIWKLDLTLSIPLKTGTRAQNMKTRVGALDIIDKRVQERKTWKLDLTPDTAENGTRRPRYRRKWGRERKAWKSDLTPSVLLKMNLVTQNMKIRLGSLGNAENGSRSAKKENWTRRHGTTKNKSGSAKHVNYNRSPQYLQEMSLGAQNKKTELVALGTIENESLSAKHENRTWRARYRQKWVWECKIWNLDPTPSVYTTTRPSAQNMKTRLGTLGTTENEAGCAK
jgi:hypothetical protein